jgi:signal transduction histidine kinase
MARLQVNTKRPTGKINPPRLPIGIRGRIAAVYTLLVAGTFLVGGLILTTWVEHYYLRSMTSIMVGQAQLAMNLLTPLKAGEIDPAAAREVAQRLAISSGARVQLLDAAGMTTADSGSLAAEQALAGEADVAKALAGEVGILRGRHKGSERVLAVSVPFRFDETQRGVVRLVSSLRVVDQVVTRVRNTWVMIAVAAVAASYGVSALLAGTVVSPLSAVTTAAEGIAAGNLHPGLKPRYRDEVGRLAETLNQMAAELSRTEKMKTDFIASVSHELRTPLTSIKGYVVNVIDSLPTGSSMRSDLETIDRETDRLTALVEELLDFQRLAGGRLAVRMVPMDMSGLIHESVRQMSPRAERQGIRLESHMPDNMPFMIEGDPARLKQVMINVLDNALKFTEPGGRVEVTAQRNNGECLIRVIDTGCGITPEDLPHVTERFYHGRHQAAGYGLGLSLVSDIIEKHGGTLNLESQVGEGTAVSIRLKRINQR